MVAKCGDWLIYGSEGVLADDCHLLLLLDALFRALYALVDGVVKVLLEDCS